MQARVVRFTAPRAVEIATVQLERPSDALLVQTQWSGISAGTELLAYRGQLPPDLVLDEQLPGMNGTFRYPFSYGYSCVGLVAEGSDNIPAGSLVFAFRPHQDWFAAGEEELVRLDPDTDPRLATLFPLVETALQISLDAGQVQRQHVLVVGLGAVGLLVSLMLQRGGAHVLATEPQPWRRELAAAVGVEAVSTDLTPGRVADVTDTRGVPLVVEVSGNPAALSSCLPLLAHEGVALVASWYGTKPVTLPLGGDFHRRRLIIRSSQVSSIPAEQQPTWDFDRRRAAARDLLEQLPVAQLATTDFPFPAAAEAYAAVDRGRPGLLHAALRYD